MKSVFLKSLNPLLTHEMPQSATLNPFRLTIPAFSHFDVLGFNLDTSENLSKTFKTSKNSYSKIFRPYIFLFDLITANMNSKTKMKR